MEAIRKGIVEIHGKARQGVTERDQDDAVRIAFEVGVEMGSRKGIDEGELVGAAWMGAMEAAGKPCGLMATAARRRAIDEIRQSQKSICWLPKNKTVSQMSTLHEANGEITIYDRPKDSRARMVELWEETGPIRRQWPLRLRVALYLYAVEGFEMREVGEMMGVSRSAISLWLKQIDPERNLFDKCGRERSFPRIGVVA